MFNSFLLLIGAYYLFAAGLAAKVHLTGAVIDTAMRAIEARATQPAERWRLIWLLLGTFWVGLAGLLALMQLQGVWAVDRAGMKAVSLMLKPVKPLIILNRG